MTAIRRFDKCSVHYRAKCLQLRCVPLTEVYYVFSSRKVSIPGYGGAAMPVCWLPAWCTCGSGSTIVTGRNETVRPSARYSPRMNSSWVPSASLRPSSEGHLDPLLVSAFGVFPLPVPRVTAGHVPLVK